MLHKVKFAVLCTALFGAALAFTSAQAQQGGVRRSAGSVPYYGNNTDDGVFLENTRNELFERWQADAAVAERNGVAIARRPPAAAAVRKAGITQSIATSNGGYVYFPTGKPNDGKFLVLAGSQGTSTLNNEINIKLAAPAGDATLSVGLFDGDIGGNWDQGSGQAEFDLFLDPEADGPNPGGGDVPVPGAHWTSAQLADNGWTDLKIAGNPIDITACPASPSGAKFFFLRCSLPSSSTGTLNCFKIRTTGSVRLQPQNSFNIIGSLSNDSDLPLIYPNYPSLAPTNYDGAWDFYVYVPVSIYYDPSDTNRLTGFDVWDGDLDYGSQLSATVRDTDDANTPNTVAALPLWAQAGTVGEGIAAGFGGTSGNPPDDIDRDIFRRGPSINYDVTDPSGVRYANANPSGNQEWERFRIETRPDVKNNPALADHAAANDFLPSGIFQVHIGGMDLTNLNSFRFEHDILGVDINGFPRQPLLPYKVGDTVFSDVNATLGVQDFDEPGIGGVKVNLLDDNGYILTSTTTNGLGRYEFNVDVGTYSVEVDASNFQTGGALYGQVSTTGNVLSRTVVDANILTYDFGYRAPGGPSIGDRVWYDLSGDGVQDANELGIAGITVRLRDLSTGDIVGATTTDGQGMYLFYNPPVLPGGAYRVEVTPPANLVQTFDRDGALDHQSDALILSAGQNDLDNDFGYRAPGVTLPPVNIGDRVWSDLNGNRLQGSNEPGLGGVRLVLSVDMDVDGVWEQQMYATTDLNGNYLFANLPPGRYCVGVDTNSLPLGMSLTADPSAATPPSKGAVLDFLHGTRDGVADATVASRNVLVEDFGYRGDASLGDTVWLDVNGNGVQDTGELGVPGLGVVLTGDFNGDGTTDYRVTATTNASGKYTFANLAAGTYTVTVNPATYAQPLTQTYDLDGLVTPNTATGNLQRAQADLTYDFGYQVGSLLGSVGDRVWLDADLDGVQDSGEAGISGVTVKLINSLGVTVGTTTTDASGNYLFSSLVAGNYAVEVSSLPAGLTQTFDLDGLATPNKASFTLAAGAAKRDVDFGYGAALGSLGDRVWLDANLNGQQDSGEAGLSGVMVTLLNSAGSPVGIATTDGDGLYLFANLAPDTYTVTVGGLPAGAVETFDLDGVDSANEASFTLGGGENKRDVDFGYAIVGSVGDQVWLDANLNGAQDSGEAGIAGITVKLLDGTGTAVATTTTDADGLYLFDQLAAGSYTVELSGVSADLTETYDLDGTGTADRASFTLAAGAAKRDVDFGYGQPASVGDRVWLDANGNGTQDSGEDGVAGATVKLLDGNGAPVATTTTDADGGYLFEGLMSGSYTAEVSGLPDGVAPTYDLDGVATANQAGFTLAAGDAKRDVDFGYVYHGSVGDRVWRDANLNGQQDSGEFGIAGVIVKLLDSDDVTVATTTTDGSGLYLFEHLPGGSYSVVVSGLPAGLTQTYDLDGLSTDDKASFTLTAGGARRDVDFGYGAVVSVGDRVWSDTNLNGAQDSGETGIPSVTVKLISSMGATLATTTTDADGLYLFENLAVGSYTVAVSGLPAGLTQTFDLDGTSTANNASFTLATGDDQRDVDFGYGTLAFVGDRVWLDANRNGQQDTGENGLSGVTVKLLNGSGATVATTTTDADGLYLFSGLVPGSYAVTVSGLPTGATQTYDLDGMATANKASFSLSAGTAKRDVDFGYGYPLASVGDRVWLDADRDGCQDAGETGLAGVTVTLRNSSGTALATRTTDADGYYLFDALAAGIYSVTVSNLPGGSTQTFDLDGLSSAHKATFSLTSGAARRDVDFGYAFAAGSLGDRVWLDCDLDGVQDSGEQGLGCVTVKLHNSSGAVIATETTHSYGYYLFENLQPGSYTVVVSGVSSGLTPTFDLDGVSTTHKTVVTLTAGQNRRDVDFGYGPMASVGDRVWKDTDRDRCQDSGEPGISGVTVKLLNSSGATVATTTTDSNGNYLFQGLMPGNYSVVVSGIPTGYSQTFDLDGTSSAHKASFTLSTGDNKRDVDFGYAPAQSSLGDRVWFDCDLDGVQDSGEQGLGCVTVKLLNGSGAVIAATCTSSSGYYLFEGLAAGSYTVVVSGVSSGLGATYDLDGTGTASKAAITLSSGENRRDVDFGYGPMASVGNRVWQDTDRDRCQDSGEPGIGGVTVKLLNSSGAVLATTTTDANGYYEFTGLKPGSYSVAVSGIPSGYSQTYDLDGTSSANKASFTLSCGDDRTDVDFGYGVSLGSIGDRVWKDTDLDGVQDSGEAGLACITVKLYSSTGTLLATTQTSSSGYYLFENLAPGSYAVVSSVPSGMSQTYDLDGTSTANKATVTLGSGENKRDVDFGYGVGNTSGSFTTYTQGGWGSNPSGNNPGALLQANFSRVFPGGVTVGGRNTVKFTSSSAVAAFLPQGGSAGTFSCSATNPSSTNAGVLGGQVVALQLSVSFSNAGVTRSGLGARTVVSGKLAGYTVNQVLTLANKVIGGETSALPSGVSISDLNAAVTAINENYDNGTVDKGYLR